MTNEALYQKTLQPSPYFCFTVKEIKKREKGTLRAELSILPTKTGIQRTRHASEHTLTERTHTVLSASQDNHSEIASIQCLQPKNETTKPQKKTWPLVLEAVTSPIHGALIIKDASLEKCRLLADDVIVSVKGGSSPATASCIQATGPCRDPWIPSLSLKTIGTAIFASLLFSISPQSKNKKEGMNSTPRMTARFSGT